MTITLVEQHDVSPLGQICDASVPARSGAKTCRSTNSGAHWTYSTTLPSACFMYIIRPVGISLMSRTTDAPFVRRLSLTSLMSSTIQGPKL